MCYSHPFVDVGTPSPQLTLVPCIITLTNTLSTLHVIDMLQQKGYF